MKSTIRIASRESKLALAQTELVKIALLKNFANLDIEIIPIKTKGDKILDTQLAKIGGKGLFVKELENLLLEDKADLAVHSMKDMPAGLPVGLKLGAITKRGAVNDVLVTNKYKNLKSLPPHSIVGTSSLRRQSQILALRPDVTIKNLRGNVITRLEKLQNQEFDAIVLAEAGLERLNLKSRITEIFLPDVMLPACGQGALGLECREDDANMLNIIQTLAHKDTEFAVFAERQVNKILNGGCQAPIAIYANITNKILTLQAKVMSIDGTKTIKATHNAPKTEFIELGNMVANALIKQGAIELIEDAKNHFNH